MAQQDLQDLSNSGNVNLSDIALSNTDNSMTSIGLQGQDLKAVANTMETAFSVLGAQSIAQSNAQNAQINADIANNQIKANTFTSLAKFAIIGVIGYLILKVFKK